MQVICLVRACINNTSEGSYNTSEGSSNIAMVKTKARKDVDRITDRPTLSQLFTVDVKLDIKQKGNVCLEAT